MLHTARMPPRTQCPLRQDVNICKAGLPGVPTLAVLKEMAAALDFQITLKRTVFATRQTVRKGVPS